MTERYAQWSDPAITDIVDEEMYGFLDPDTGQLDWSGYMDRLGQLGIRPDSFTYSSLEDRAMGLRKDIIDDALRGEI